MEIFDEESNAPDPDWSKMATKALNAGYREGKSSAQESLYQPGFDCGYEAGFKTGFSFGLLHGIQRLKTNVDNEMKSIALKGNCQMCDNSDLLENDSMKYVENFQMKQNKEKIETCIASHSESIKELG